jgi:hypothetical protein
MLKQKIILIQPKLRDKPKNEIPYNLSKQSSIASIIGAYSSVLLTIIIFVYTCNTATKVENMDNLIRKQDTVITRLVEQNRSQNKIIKSLDSLQLVSIETSTKISENIYAIKTQTNFLQTNTKPEITPIKISLNKKPDGTYVESFTIKNFGGRMATRIVVFLYNFQRWKDSVHLFNTANVSNEIEQSFLEAGKESVFETTFDKNLGEVVKEAIWLLKIIYKDPLTGKTHTRNFYNKYDITNNTLDVSDLKKGEIKLVQDCIKRNSFYLKSRYPDIHHLQMD